MLPVIKKISKYNYSKGNKPAYIVIHDTGNFSDTAANNANYFCAGNHNASAHYFVDENSIYQVVEEFNCAWHCGDGNGKNGISNSNSIGIEMCNKGGAIANKTKDNTIELIKSLQAKYNIPNERVVRHYDASRKICPKNMSKDNWKLWKEFKARLSPVKYAIDTVVIITNPIDEIIAKYLYKAFGWGILMLNQYQIGSARRVVAVGDAVGKLKADIELIGNESYNTEDIVLKYIKENKK